MANAALLAQPGNHFGAWNDTENGQVCLDISVVVFNEDEAQELGRQHDQIAFFNLATFDTVKVVYPEGWQHGATWQGPGGPHAIEGRPSDAGAAGEAVRAPDGSAADGAGAAVGAGNTRSFFQSAPHRTVAEAFHSRLVRAVEASPQAKASGAQWKAAIRNSKTGVNQDEFAFVRIADLEDGRSYTKQEVLDYLRTNELQVETVSLQDVTATEVTERADASVLRGRMVDETGREIEDRMRDARPGTDVVPSRGRDLVGVRRRGSGRRRVRNRGRSAEATRRRSRSCGGANTFDDLARENVHLDGDQPTRRTAEDDSTRTARESSGTTLTQYHEYESLTMADRPSETPTVRCSSARRSSRPRVRRADGGREPVPAKERGRQGAHR